MNKFCTVILLQINLRKSANKILLRTEIVILDFLDPLLHL